MWHTLVFTLIFVMFCYHCPPCGSSFLPSPVPELGRIFFQSTVSHWFRPCTKFIVNGQPSCSFFAMVLDTCDFLILFGPKRERAESLRISACRVANMIQYACCAVPIIHHSLHQALAPAGPSSAPSPSTSTGSAPSSGSFPSASSCISWGPVLESGRNFHAKNPCQERFTLYPAPAELLSSAVSAPLSATSSANPVPCPSAGAEMPKISSKKWASCCSDNVCLLRPVAFCFPGQGIWIRIWKCFWTLKHSLSQWTLKKKV